MDGGGIMPTSFAYEDFKTGFEKNNIDVLFFAQ